MPAASSCVRGQGAWAPPPPCRTPGPSILSGCVKAVSPGRRVISSPSLSLSIYQHDFLGLPSDPRLNLNLGQGGRGLTGAGKWGHFHSTRMKVQAGPSHSSNIRSAPETFGCGASRLNTRISMPLFCPRSTFHICVCKMYICVGSSAPYWVPRGSCHLWKSIVVFLKTGERVKRAHYTRTSYKFPAALPCAKANFFCMYVFEKLMSY